jgi:hypothetical protein
LFWSQAIKTAGASSLRSVFLDISLADALGTTGKSSASVHERHLSAQVRRVRFGVILRNACLVSFFVLHMCAFDQTKTHGSVFVKCLFVLPL